MLLHEMMIKPGRIIMASGMSAMGSALMLSSRLMVVRVRRSSGIAEV
jgi:hypothetical protein